MQRRGFIHQLARATAGAGSMAALASAWAQGDAVRPIHMVVGFPAGGGTDVFARAVAQGLATELGQPTVVDNKPGAGGVLASQWLRQAAPDGYTLLAGSTSTQVIAPLLYARPPYQPSDFTPIAHIASVGIVLVAHATAPFDDVAQLLQYARAHPGQLNYASGGNGVTNHLAMELLKSRTGVHLVHIPYRGSAPALADVIGGQVSLMFDSVASSGPQIRAGKVKALGIAGPARLDALPGVPTLAESGVAPLKDFDVTGWVALYGPKGLAPAAVQRLAGATQRVLASADIVKRFALQGASPHFLDSAALAAFERSESAKWAQAVRHSGARLD